MRKITMKSIKKSTYCKLTAALAFVVIAAVCTWALWPKDYDELIPAEAKAVFCIDSKMLSNTLSDKDKKAFEEQGAAAFDLSQPIYGIVTPNEYLCVIARVKDVDKVKDALSHFECKRIVVDEYDGREWAWLSDGWLA